jgi:plasmid stabilization system protein ParE
MPLEYVTFQDEARSELLAAIAYYSAIRSGLAEQFVAAVEQATSLACTFPLAGAPAAADCHRITLRKFPFNVIYQVEHDAIVVVAISHHAREPDYWVARV